MILGDLLDQGVVSKAMEGVEVVFHQAALRSVPFSVENPALVNRVNVEGTINILIAARDAKVRELFSRLLLQFTEIDWCFPIANSLPKPVSPYAVSKLAGEYYCRVFSQLYGLETVSFRYFNVFGPRQDPNSQYAAVIPRFIHWSIGGEPLEVHGDGLQSRDFTYIDNVVAANLLAAQCTDGIGEVINVGQGNAYTFSILQFTSGDLRDEARLLHTRQAGRRAPHPGGYFRGRALLGYTPRSHLRRESLELSAISRTRERDSEMYR